MVDTAEITLAWNLYKRLKTKTLRNRLADHYLPLVDPVASKLHRRLPTSVDVSDLQSDGALGLLDAIENFDLSKGKPFEAYARQRIRGAMLDGLRQVDPVSRTVRTHVKKLESAADELRSTLGRPASTEELSRKLGVGPRRLQQLQRDQMAQQCLSLSGTRSDNDAPGTQWNPQTLGDRRAADPSREATYRSIRDQLMRDLTRAERLIILLYYCEEMTMREIGLTLDLSEARVSQLHKQICARLRATVEPKLLAG